MPGAADDIIINSGVTVTVPGGYSASCNSINFTTGTTGLASITLASSTSSLTVSGAVTIQEQASGGNTNQINVGAGTFSAASVALSATSDASRASQLQISTGTVTISGNITSSGSASRIIFSGTGRLNAGGSFMSGTPGTFTPSTSTVNFNGAGAQNVGAYIFNNLVLSGSGAKTMPAGASVTDNMSITGSATASVAAGQNLSVGTLTLGGVGTADGTWGSTSSPAINQTNTYFALTTGYLTVATDTRTPQGTLVVTGPASVTYGATGTITYAGGSGTGAMSYSQGASTGCTVNGSTGVITVTNVPGNCIVTVTKAADKNYLVATSEGFDVTLLPRPVTLTGTRAFDTTNVAVAAILSITNKVGSDAVSVASGSATLASANVGTRAITSMNTLALGGANAANYTLSGASGSVIITKADQAALTVTGPASVTYGTTGTITYSGGSGTGAISYSHGSSTACTVNSSTGVITLSSVSGSCTVTVTKAADSNYNLATSAGFGVTPAPRPVTLTGSRVYDTTNLAVAAILSVTNKVGSDSVNVASGSATLASANAGTQTITSMNTLALGGANAANYTLSGASGSVTITKANQTITFPAPASPAAYLSTFQVSPTSDSLLPVTVTPSGACSILGSTVTMTSGTGTCTLTASQAGSINYNPASEVVRTVTATKIDQAALTVTGPASVAYGSTGTITYTGGSGTGAMSYSHGSSTACTVNSSTGVITVSSVSGSCTVTVTKAADSNYNLATSAGFDVTPAPRPVTLTGSRVYDTTNLAAAAILSVTNKVGSDSVNVASGSATLASANAGTQTITSMNTLALGGANAANYTLSGASGSVTITKANQTITFPAPASPAAYLSTFQVSPTSDSLLPVTVTPSGACSILGSTVTMTSGTGTCTLTASQAGSINYNPASEVVRTVTATKIDQATLTVTGPASVAYGSTGTITYSGGSGTGAITYGNLTAMGCTVNSSTGVITVTNVSAGCIVIVTKAADGNYNEASAYGIIPLLKGAQAALTVTGPASLTYGTTGTITFTGGSGTGEISYSRGASTGCMVNGSTGVITVTNVSGSCTVSVTKAADSNYEETTSAGFVINLNKATGSVSIDNIPVHAVVGGWFTPTFAKLGDGPATFVLFPSSVCSVIAGMVHFDDLGTCTLQAFVAEGTNYLAATGPLQSFDISEPFRIYLLLITR